MTGLARQCGPRVPHCRLHTQQGAVPIHVTIQGGWPVFCQVVRDPSPVLRLDDAGRAAAAREIEADRYDDPIDNAAWAGLPTPAHTRGPLS